MCSTWLLTDTCVCLPLPPGHAHPTSSSHRQFPRIPGGCRLWGELPQQHRGAVTAGPGAAGEQAGVAGGHRLPWVLVGAEHVLGNARTRLLAHCTSTPAHMRRERALLPTIALEGTAPWHGCAAQALLTLSRWLDPSSPNARLQPKLH